MPSLAYGILPAFAVQKAHETPRHLRCGAVLVCAYLLPARVLPLNGQQIPQSTKNMACQCVKKQVVGGPRPCRSCDHSTCLDNLGVQGYYKIHSWYVLDQDDHGERVVGAVIGGGCTHSWYNKPDDHLHAIAMQIKGDEQFVRSFVHSFHHRPTDRPSDPTCGIGSMAARSMMKSFLRYRMAIWSGSRTSSPRPKMRELGATKAMRNLRIMCAR